MPASRSPVAASTTAPRVTKANPPSTETRATPIAASSETAGTPGRGQHVDRPVQGGHDLAVLEAGQAGRIEHVSACLLISLEAGDGVGQVEAIVQVESALGAVTATVSGRWSPQTG